MTTAAKKFPSFFKVFLPEHNSERLHIPNAFVALACFEERVPKVFILRNCSGRVWHVEARHIGDRIYFDDGWKRFVEENSLEAGNFIIFTYDGSNGFKFKIFELSGCEKTEVKEEEEHGNKDDYVREMEEIEEEAEEEGEEIEINEEEEQEEEDCVMEEEDDDNYDDDHDDDDVKNMRIPVVSKKGTARSSTTMAKQLKNYGIDAKKYVQPDNPYFIAKGIKKRDNIHEKRTSNRDNELQIPKILIKDFSLSLPETITLYLCCPDIQRHQVRDHHLSLPEQTPIRQKRRIGDGKVCTWKDGRVCIRGWASFCRKNEIEENDACICEFVLGEDEKTEMLQVHVAKRQKVLAS